MSVKKYYRPGDTVWIYGVSRKESKPTQGSVVHYFTLDHAGYNEDVHYVISVPNEIEPLLEVRTWHNISQDVQGPVGMFRSLVPPENLDAVNKKLSQIGLDLDHEINMTDTLPVDQEPRSRRRYQHRKKNRD
jgi:hypothetical protein